MDECGGFCCARPACIIIIIVQEGLLCASGNEILREERECGGKYRMAHSDGELYLTFS